MLQQLRRRLEVGARVADAHQRRGERDAGEAVLVKAEKIGHGRYFTPCVLWCSMPYTESVVVPSGRVTVYLDGDAYRLSYNDLVVYENGKRKVRGKVTPYEFRSVEKLRYDFENDVE